MRDMVTENLQESLSSFFGVTGNLDFGDKKEVMKVKNTLNIG